MSVEKVKVNNSFVFDTPIDAEHITSDVDLYLSDENGNALAEFYNGEFRTKEFNSKYVKLTVTDTYTNGDLCVTDGLGNVIVKLKDGHIQTKFFNSKNLSIIGKSDITYTKISTIWSSGETSVYFGENINGMYIRVATPETLEYVCEDENGNTMTINSPGSKWTLIPTLFSQVTIIGTYGLDTYNPFIYICSPDYFNTNKFSNNKNPFTYVVDDNVIIQKPTGTVEIRIPSLCVDDDGTIYGVYEVRAGEGSGDYYADSAICLLKVKDGLVLSNRRVIEKQTGDLQVFDPQIIKYGNKLYCFYFAAQSGQGFAEVDKNYYTYSTDGGSTWQTPVEMFTQPSGKNVTTSPNCPLIYDGKIIIPLRCHQFTEDSWSSGLGVFDPETNQMQNIYLIQDLWNQTYGIQCNECSVYDNRDGYVYLSCRDEKNGYHDPCWQRIFRINLNAISPSFEFWNNISNLTSNEGWTCNAYNSVFRVCGDPNALIRRDQAVYMSFDNVTFEKVLQISDKQNAGYCTINYNKISDIVAIFHEETTSEIGDSLRLITIKKTIKNI